MYVIDVGNYLPKCQISKSPLVNGNVTKICTQQSDNNCHQLMCDGKVKFNLPRGSYKNNPSVFEDIERLGCQNIEEEDKTGKWFVCFDFEAYQCNFDDRVDDVECCRKIRAGIKYTSLCRFLWVVI